MKIAQSVLGIKTHMLCEWSRLLYHVYMFLSYRFFSFLYSFFRELLLIRFFTWILCPTWKQFSSWATHPQGGLWGYRRYLCGGKTQTYTMGLHPEFNLAVSVLYKVYCYIARLSRNKMSTVIGWFFVTCLWSNSNVSRPGYNCAVVARAPSLLFCFCYMKV